MADISKATPLTVCVSAKVQIGRSPTGRDWVCVIGEGNTTFAETFGATEGEAHAAAVRVKRAVNSYEPMLEALKAVHETSPLGGLSDLELNEEAAQCQKARAILLVRKAIALAEGKQS